MDMNKTYLRGEEEPAGWIARLTKLLGKGVRAHLEATGPLSTSAGPGCPLPDIASEEEIEASDKGPVVGR